MSLTSEILNSFLFHFFVRLEPVLKKVNAEVAKEFGVALTFELEENGCKTTAKPK